jgi:protein-disulfide isomerase
MSSKLNTYIVPISIIVAGALVAGAVVLSKGATTTGGARAGAPAAQQAAPGEPQEIKVSLSPVTDADHIQGNPDAELVIVEYSDFECPFCAKFHPTMEQVMEEYGKDGKVAWVYRHYPLSRHAQAQPSAEASECVAKIGGDAKFFEYAKKLFAGTPQSLSKDALLANATAIGIDAKAFNECVASSYGRDQVAADVADANLITKSAPGGFGTPYSIIVAKDGSQFVIEGAQPYFRVKQIIDTLLAK